MSNLNVYSSAEPFRVSNFILVRGNVFDPANYINVTIAYLICRLIIGYISCSFVSFVALFGVLFFALDNHVESFRSFVAVRQTVAILHEDYKLRQDFLRTHLGFNPSTINLNSTNHDNNQESNVSASTSSTDLEEEEEEIDDNEVTPDGTKRESFRWLNRIIEFFWPYLSHVIHFELNEFFRNEIESGLLAGSDAGVKRLFYAIVRQLNTNVLLIERCQLGDRAPNIKDIVVREGTAKEINETTPTTALKTTITTTNKSTSQYDVKDAKSSSQKSEILKEVPSVDGTEVSINNKGKTLVYDINLRYSGDMNISVIYRYLCCCVSRIGLKDVFLHFKMRFIWGPIHEDIPFIDQLSVTLLELPQFGYKGIALVELAELQIARGVINRLITENLLYPRMLSISFKQLIEKLANGPKTKVKKREEEEEKERQQAERGSKKDVSCMTKMTANLLLLGCLCSNAFLRLCQKTRRPPRTVNSQKTISS